MEYLFQKLIDTNYPFPTLFKEKRGLKQLYSLLDKSIPATLKIEKTTHTPSEISTKYFPEQIQKLILQSNTYEKKIIIRTPLRVITIHFVFMKQYNYHDFSISHYFKYLQLWFGFMDLVTPNEEINKTLDITIYLTKTKKEMPENKSQILDSYNINSAFTYICEKHGHITIYREEEWFKVLLHECIHSYCLDFSNFNQEFFGICLHNVLPIRLTDPQYSETYAEVWGELMNIALISYLLTDSWKEFSLHFEFYLQIELVHSITTANSLLKRNDLSFECLREKRTYNQNTHVFEYHILKSIVLFSSGKFLDWSLDNNGYNMIPINISRIKSLCSFIKHSYNNPLFIRLTKIIGDRYSSKSLRMSICEV